jgi:hypothetical protein
MNFFSQFWRLKASKIKISFLKILILISPVKKELKVIPPVLPLHGFRHLDLYAALGGGRRLGFDTWEEPAAWFQRAANALSDATVFQNIFVFLSIPFLIQHINGKSGGQ